MRIANPVYDTVFKYLLDDLRVARLLIGALLDETVEEVTLRPTEVRTEAGDLALTVLRLDFTAAIRLASGERKLVLIEIQKAQFPTDIMRFRRYLGEQYAAKANTWSDDAGRTHALPIISIYFLGHELSGIAFPVTRVSRVYVDATTGETGAVRDPFIESLTHDSVVIQIPRLKERRRTDLEKLLSVFDQTRCAGGSHELEINEEELPEKYREVVRRLVRASAERQVRAEMDVEDEVLQVISDHVRQTELLSEKVVTQAREITQKDGIISEQAHALAEKESALAEKNSALAEKDSDLAEKSRELEAQARLIEELKQRLGMT